ncbi:related to ADIPOR-like receptor IZH2 [Zygosaccharomyces bailii]|nr:related to ADIPOR-like receptor IZH2 [Zygosaccharomyces bailii]
MPGLQRRPVASAVLSQTETNVTVRQEDNKIDYSSVKTTKKLLYTWNEIPDWQKDNELILGSYVRETNSIKECCRSLFYLHNESVNIYTHFLPSLCFLLTFLFDTFVIPTYETTTWIDYMVIDIFFLGAFCCLILSSTFHCFKCHSHKVAIFGNKLDYLGIIVLIVSSMTSILYYGFYDNGKLFYSFNLITLIFGVACAVVSLDETFRTREWRSYRAGLFVAFGLSAILPVMAGIVHYGFRETCTRIQLKWVSLEGFLYIFGAFLYGARFPERVAPGKFDVWGHSHQLFHVLVVIAALCHLTALLESYKIVHIYLRLEASPRM